MFIKYLLKLKGKKLFLLIGSAFLLASCAGVRADINLKADGSGTIALEYRFPQSLESWGKLDGNADLPPIPVSKADFDRSIRSVDGLTLVSFSSKSEKKGEKSEENLIVNTANLKFTKMNALLGFLDANGGKASFSEESGKKRLRLTLIEKTEEKVDEDLLALFASLSEGFNFSLRITLPSENPGLFLTDGQGNARSMGKISKEGKTVSFSAPLADLLSAQEGVVMEIVW